MQVIDERCAGIAIHKKTVVVTVLITQANGQVQKFTRTFSTMTVELLALADWLDSLQVVQIAMESTGVLMPVLSMATWVTPKLTSQVTSCCKPRVVVAKVCTSRLTLPLALVSNRQATTVTLWTSSPAQRSYKTRIPIAVLLCVLLY